MNEVQKSKSKGWMIACIALIVFSVCATTALFVTGAHNKKLQASVERGYEQGLYDLGDNLNNMEVNLSKLMIAPDGKYAAVLLSDVYNEALSAERALSDLPIDWEDAQELSHFFNRVADFAICYQQALINGKASKGFSDNLENIYVTTRVLQNEIEDSVSLVAQNKLDIRRISSVKPYAYRFRDGEIIEHNAVDYPELIYDGPFSDGRKDESYAYLCDLPDVSLDEAKKIALSALPDFAWQHIESAGKSAKEPLYELTLSGKDAHAYVCVSEHGGKIVNLTVSRPLGNVLLGEKTATERAQAFAARLGYEVQPVWYLATGGVAYVNLAPIEGDVVLYTDLVKVKVALDNGDVLGLEAKNFCLNHTERNTRLTMNRNAVPALVDSRLQIQNIRGALIPLENNASRLCYEVSATYKGLDYFVYLDAENGETVKVMRVVDSAQGKMTM